ncbi:MAG: hypothetical protein GTN62_06210 [Gemmatimonadales bacterium]|nr:hypothetical protein [Gemmatimonadales bacterium]NIN11092.1 hypothetical protein [Gemmatimonadales bacterium]NIN49689.1 hypothetical protein [Gemmatimonadales bacterium]NIP07153.1 hypothetical protein [Gemmatimonadales bacterium]
MVLAVLAAVTPLPAAAQNVAELDVNPRDVRLGVGERKEVLAVAYDSDGDIMSVTFQWATTNPQVVQVEEDPSLPGVAYLRGIGPGTAQVEVRAGTQTRQVSVQVTGAAIAGPPGVGAATILQIEPTAVFLFPTEDIQLQPLFLKDDGTRAEATTVSWSWLGGNVAQVDQTGRVVGIAPGRGLVEATTPTGLRRRVQVQVATAEWAFSVPIVSLSPTESDTVRVRVPTQSNRPVDPRSLTWRTSNPNVAVVSPVGIVTAIGGGRAEIVAAGFGQETRLPITVHREVVTMTVRSPPGDTVAVPLGGTVTFAATPLGADDRPVADAPLIWIVGDTSKIAYRPVDSVAVGKRIGLTTLTVRAPGDLEKTWTLNVIASGLVLDRTRLGIGLDDRVSLAASFADSTGVPLAPASEVTWTSSNTAVLQVERSGELRPLSYGRAQVVASTPWGNADTAEVFVQGEILVTSMRAGSPDVFAFERSAPAQFIQITHEPSQEFSPAYSPDGSRIAFVTDRDGNFEVYVVDAVGSNVQRLTTSPATEGYPAWSPDGRQIFYQSDADGTMQIWAMNADGSNQRQLTRAAGVNQQPAVSPDGNTVAFASTRDGNYEIYLMNLDGANQRNFTLSQANETAPAWMGDSAIAFVREDRSGGTPTRMVTRMNFAREESALTQVQLTVTDFAIAKGGDLLAAVVMSPGPTGATIQRLFLIPLGQGSPSEVPRQGERDQLVTPAFRP